MEAGLIVDSREREVEEDGSVIRTEVSESGSRYGS